MKFFLSNNDLKKLFEQTMSSTAILVFPHQLFEEHALWKKAETIYLVEEQLFFRQFNFHPHKIIFHRASMQHFAESRLKKGMKVKYIDATNSLSDIRLLIPGMGKEGVQLIHYIDPDDDWLERRFKQSAADSGIQLVRHDNPSFLITVKEADEFFSQQKRYFQTDFYTWQRKRTGLLVLSDGKPAGGKWSFDAENRKRFPRAGKPPAIQFPKSSTIVSEATIYAAEHFEWKYGGPDPFFYPITSADARKWLDDFLENRFRAFGDYEDAMLQGETVLHHSLLSPLLNAGLLLPGDVLNKALDAAKEFKVPLNSLEGFVRQVLGWREFIRQLYAREGRKQRTRNYWGFTRKIPESFWQGSTGMLPFDVVTNRVKRSAYAHHIERLMVLGNLMLLCEFDPDEVYRWFMSFFIDAYDWVMVPNIYGMSQFADAGLMTTKPYISGSNYLLKMGDWEKGEWQNTWDGLFWRFMHVHRDFFLQNPRLGMLVRQFDQMPAEKRNRHLQHAEKFLDNL
jgi:deoxyribodipyrimidine photolyase-related protein